jgi:SAM-dependent methyltransferase
MHSLSDRTDHVWSGKISICEYNGLTTRIGMHGFQDPLNTWNQRFAQAGYLFGQAPNQYLVQQAGHLRAGRALAVADGEGRNGVWLAEQGLAVDAFDFSPVALDKARALAQARGVQVHWVCSDWQHFDWQAQAWDNVVAIFIQFATPDERAQLFARMDASLRPGGTLVLQGYGHDQLRYNTGGPGKREHLYDEALLLAAFAGYEVLDLRSYEADLSEGSGHSGRSALVGLTARKPS